MDTAQGKGESECYIFSFVQILLSQRGKKLPFSNGHFTGNNSRLKEGYDLAVLTGFQLQDSSLFSCTNSTPYDWSRSKARILCWSKVSEGPLFSSEIPLSSCILPTWQGQVARAGAHSHHQLRLAQTSWVFRIGAVFLAFPQTTGTVRSDLDLWVVTKKEGRALATLGLPLAQLKSFHMTQPGLLGLYFGVGGQWPSYYSVHLWSLMLGHLAKSDRKAQSGWQPVKSKTGCVH